MNLVSLKQLNKSWFKIHLIIYMLILRIDSIIQLNLSMIKIHSLFYLPTNKQTHLI